MSDIPIHQQRLVYIVTYSRADTTKFPTRQSFADAVVEAWRVSGFSVQRWVVSLEAHANDDPDCVTMKK